MFSGLFWLDKCLTPVDDKAFFSIKNIITEKLKNSAERMEDLFDWHGHNFNGII